MKKIFFLACMACTLCLFSSCEKKGSKADDGSEVVANTITFKGTIKDYDDHSPISGTLITLMPGHINTYSAEDGRYIINAKCTTENANENGTWTFTITCQVGGYKTDRRTVNMTSSDIGKDFVINFSLRKE